MNDLKPLKNQNLSHSVGDPNSVQLTIFRCTNPFEWRWWCPVCVGRLAGSVLLPPALTPGQLCTRTSHTGGKAKMW